MPLSENDIKDLIIKEMDYVQSVISRMASNSFQLKGWLIGILSFITAFNKDAIFADSPAYLAILIMPVLVFWYLDAFFLYTEQQYRDLYKDISTNRVKFLFNGQLPDELKNLFNLDYTRYEDHLVARKSIWEHLVRTFKGGPFKALKDTSQPLVDDKKAPTIFRVMFSKTLLVFYALPLIFIGIIVFRPAAKKADKVQQIEIKGMSDMGKSVTLQLDSVTLKLLWQLKNQERAAENDTAGSNKELFNK